MPGRTPRAASGRTCATQAPRTGSTVKLRSLLLAAMVMLATYFFAGACLLRFALDPLVFLHIAPSGHAATPPLLRIPGPGGSAMLLRRYGTAEVGCVLFFPGRHGLLPAYEKGLFEALTAHGIGVLAVAYPGQNGAPGNTYLSDISALATQAVAAARSACPGHQIVVYGRSLGSMVAAYAAGQSHPAGLVLESAAPSLSSAIRLRLRERWYLAPLALLPLSRIIPHDFSLTEALSDTRRMPSIVFQGTADIVTPLPALRAGGIPPGLQLVTVPGGGHSNTYVLAQDRIVRTVRCMLLAPHTGAK